MVHNVARRQASGTFFNLSKWKKLLGRFHGSEVASWSDDPRVKVVKLDVKVEPFPGSPQEDFEDQTLYEAYCLHSVDPWREL